MATKVLDSWALIAFFEDEPAAETVEKILEQAAADRHKLLISVVNWGEVYYNVMRKVSQEAAEQKIKEIAAMPVEIVGVDADLTKQAAIYKATKKMSYADCFGAALAKIKNAEFVTGDPGIQGSREGNQNQLAEIVKGNNMNWHFRPLEAGETTREPIQGEFYSTEAIRNPTEALVRRGNPLGRYHPADFKIGSGGVQIAEQSGLRVAARVETIRRRGVAAGGSR